MHDLIRPPRNLGGGRAVDPIEREQIEQRMEHRKRVNKIYELLKACGLPPRYGPQKAGDGQLIPGSGPSLARVAPPNDVRAAYLKAVHAIRRLETEAGIIALLGPRGVGKTWIAAALVLDFCRAERSARWLHAMDYFEGLKATYGDRTAISSSRHESDHQRPQLLVLDEVHERGDTAWEDRQLIRLVTKRHELQLATILISNQDEQKFKARIGDSILSRMKDDAGTMIVCDWRSLRGAAS